MYDKLKNYISSITKGMVNLDDSHCKAIAEISKEILLGIQADYTAQILRWNDQKVIWEHIRTINTTKEKIDAAVGCSSAFLSYKVVCYFKGNFIKNISTVNPSIFD